MEALVPNIFSSNENLHARLGGEIAYRGWCILGWYIEVMRFGRECRYWTCGHQRCDKQNINHARMSPDSKTHNPSPSARIEGARLRRGWMRRVVSPSVSRRLRSRAYAQVDGI